MWRNLTEIIHLNKNWFWACVHYYKAVNFPIFHSLDCAVDVFQDVKFTNVTGIDLTGVEQLTDAFFIVMQFLCSDSSLFRNVDSLSLVGCTHITDLSFVYITQFFSSLKQAILYNFSIHLLLAIHTVVVISVSLVDLHWVAVLWRCWLSGRKGIRPVKNWLVGCWHGYLSRARWRLAYGPAYATATRCLLLQ